MSNQQIKLAHRNRELPKVDNPTWKMDSDEAGSSKESTEIASVSIAAALDTPSTSGLNNNSPATPTKNSTQNTYIGHKIPEDFLKKAGLLGNTDGEDETQIEPLYKLNRDGSVPGRYYRNHIQCHLIISSFY